MVVLKEMVGQKVIDGFRGVIDFYYWKIIPVARTWPRKPKGPRSPASQLTAQIFKQASEVFHDVTPAVQEAYAEMVTGTNLTWKDMFFRGYVSGTLRFFFSVDELEETP